MSNPQQQTKKKAIFASQSLSAGASATGTVDTLGADYLEISVNVGSIATAGHASSNGVTIAVTESDDTNASTFAAISGVSDVTGIKYLRLHELKLPRKVAKRYVKLTVTAGTSGVSNEAVVVGAIQTLSDLEVSPSTAAGMVEGSNDTCVVGA